MLNITDWIPDGIRKNKVATWLISTAGLMAVAAAATYAALNVTKIDEMKGRIEGLVQQNQHLRQDLQTLQARYDNAMGSREDDVSKRVSEMATAWRDSMNTLSARYENTLKENQDLKNALSAADRGDRRRASELKESRLSALNTALLSNSNRIAEKHNELYETSATAAYYKKECEKKDGGAFSNLCEMASKYGAQAASLRELISSLEKDAEIFNAQILALDGRNEKD